MELIYIITVLVLLITTMLEKKSEKRQNILLILIIEIIIFTAYNVAICIMFSVFNIKCTLLALSSVNIIIIMIKMYLLYKKKEFQKYTIKIVDIVFLIVLLIFVIAIGIVQYGGLSEIKYETTDPAIHFNWAKEFYNVKQLKWGELMPAALVNTGILFDTFDFMIAEESFYILYMVFDLIMLYLMGAVLYLGIVDKIRSTKKSIIAMIFTLIFLFGYPLNSMIFGFAYLSLGMLYMVTLIVIGIYAKNGELKLISTCKVFFLLTFGLFFSYYFFVPVVYSSFGLYLLFDMIKNRKAKNIFSIFTKENITKILLMLIMPTIIGFCYFVLPGLLENGKTMIGHISTEGYIYRELYSNFVLLAPLSIFYVLYNVKNKRNSLSTIMGVISIVFTLYLLKKGLRAEVSSYYYFKMYFLIWILLFYMNIKAMFIMIDNKNEMYAYSFSMIFLMILAVGYTKYDYKISEINILFNPENRINSFANIYIFNQSKLCENANIYTKNQINAVKDLLRKAGSDKSSIMINGNPLQMLWANSVWKITDTTDIRELQIQKELNIREWLENENKKYLIYFDTNKEVEKETEKYKTIYDTKEVVILEKKQ